MTLTFTIRRTVFIASLFLFLKANPFIVHFFGKQKLNVLNLHRLNPNRTDSVTFLPYNAQTIEHQSLTDTGYESGKYL